MVLTNYPGLLPKGYREQLTVPEIKEGLTYDETTGFGKIATTGDVSHYKQTDNPIVEIFRAVEQECRKDGISVTAGCPQYDSATHTTTCFFLPNNVDGLRGAKFDKAAREAIEKVKQPFEEALTAYFQQEEGGFRDYQVYRLLLSDLTNNKDLVDELVAQCDRTIKDFIKSKGYKLPKRRVRQKAVTPLTWDGLLKSAMNL